VARVRSRTAWIIAGATAVVVVAVSVAIIVVSLRRDPPTESVERTTTVATSPTTTIVPTTTEMPATTTTEPAAVDETDVTINVGARERSYLLITPQEITDEERLPVVVVLHGLGVNAQAMSRTAAWRQAVESERFIAVFPRGEADSWNMGPCCPPANLMGVDDIGFLDAVVAEMNARADVASERMYLTGFSNGGIMVYAFACARPGLFAAVAPFAGSNITGCHPDEPVSLLHHHSDPDSVVPYDGGPSFGRLLSARDFPDVPTSVGQWAQRSGCGARTTSRTDGDDVEHISWSDCPDGIEVGIVRVPGRGHAWPNRGDYDPLARTLEFFELN
jgi:polyhydroxybutyrate depolymerase